MTYYISELFSSKVRRGFLRSIAYWQVRISILIICLTPILAIAQTASHEKTIVACAREANGNWVHHNARDPRYRKNVLDCLGYTMRLIDSGEIDSKKCWIRIVKGADSRDQCKLYNNSLSSLKEVIKIETQAIRNANYLFLNSKIFKGSKCTVDCSGHKAGYNWAFEKHVTDYSECNSQSPSFNRGCEIYVDEVHAGDHHTWNDHEM